MNISEPYHGDSNGGDVHYMSLCMPWLQVLDESEKSGWGDEVKKYQVHGIPDFALIDGDSGIVIACDIGGEELDSTIAKALESKTQNK